MRVFRMAKARTSKWRMKHLTTLFIICFVWYAIITRRKFSDDKESLLRLFYRLGHFGKEASTTNPPSPFSVRQLSLSKAEKERKVKHDSPKKIIQNDIDVTINTKPPIILVWKAMEYQMKNYKTFLEYYAPENCGGCQVTTNRSLVKECAALVHFNSPDLRKFLDVPDPKYRNPDQIYAFWSRETPAKTQHFKDELKSDKFDKIFNLTINFRHDSDIVDYFGNIEYELRIFKQRNKRNMAIDKIYKQKNALAIWIVSNCDSTYGAAERMKYAKSLIKAGLSLTTYGDCFNNRFSGPDMNKEIMRHKFYMSLENSIHCPDYVSEKFWRNGLRAGAVPVVWGPTREDVARIAPKHSYIHSEDFKTPEDLVKYLNYLDKNDTAYREYHAWRFEPIDESIPEEDIVPNHYSTFCRLCKKVTQKPLVHQTIPSVTKWLYETGYVDDKCFK
uniref:3-galactosyl-N-acetylglucosaminide 4-alpha-L-fucosyltransferase FUT3-like n=1 Tax=Styela clava TaxID=7725 RepID=UPI00193A8F99|nr:3-galactosyl-N-acetylglucosaminide 4-alpha-L-fucosyltransferase FUT3-like [Styela clava]